MNALTHSSSERLCPEYACLGHLFAAHVADVVFFDDLQRLLEKVR